jgi:hypothetical protein
MGIQLRAGRNEASKARSSAQQGTESTQIEHKGVPCNSGEPSLIQSVAFHQSYWVAGTPFLFSEQKPICESHASIGSQNLIGSETHASGDEAWTIKFLDERDVTWATRALNLLDS